MTVRDIIDASAEASIEFYFVGDSKPVIILDDADINMGCDYGDILKEEFLEKSVNAIKCSESRGLAVWVGDTE